jgi:predicted HTH transcriptional regulator
MLWVWWLKKLNMKFAETDRLELKEKLTGDLEKEAVAFLNADGGDIYIGVKNSGVPVGIKGDIDATLLKIKGRLLDGISPSTMGLFTIKTDVIDSKTVIRISLKKGKELLYYIKDRGVSESGCFIRLGTSAHPMTRAMICGLQSRMIPRTLVKLESPEQDLEFGDLFIHYRTNKRPLDEGTFDKTLNFRTSDGKYNYLAYLMADNNQISIRLGRFDDSNGNFELIEKGVDFGDGCLITGLKRLLDRMEIENITLSRLTGAAQRMDKRLVDNKSMREVIINAFAHNDYSIGMLPICEVFTNRFAVRSYGGLLPELTKEAFFNGVSQYRNPELMRIFKDLRITEGLGFGVRKILLNYDREIFEFGDGYLYVQLPFDEEVMASRNAHLDESGEKNAEEIVDNSVEKSVEKNTESVEKSVGGVEKSVEKTEGKVLRLLAKHRNITIGELAKALNIGTTAVGNNLRKLKNQGKIRRVGPDKGGHWEVSN